MSQPKLQTSVPHIGTADIAKLKEGGGWGGVQENLLHFTQDIICKDNR